MASSFTTSCLQSLLTQESGRRSLPKHGFLKDDTKERRDHAWMILSFICLIVVVLGVLCSIILMTYMISGQSPDEAKIPVDTLATFHVKTKTMPDTKRLLEEHELWSSPAPVNTSPARRPFRSTSQGGECTSFLCRYAGQWLRSKIDYSANPCKDFYRFVCGSFRGYDEFNHLARGIEVTTMAFLGDLSVPYSNQNSQQKAAGMYQACIAFAKSGRTETHYLVEWMVSLNLDLKNKTRLAAVNPVEMMVRGSLDLGVKAVLAIVLFNQSEYNRRPIKVRS
ncbi:hypothetical protein HPB49_015056 [Dermacentor silvarum]|uniref:Uncharacterized protein n=1 Tax=Dermacentor silvarum TaxID=543639 RepID=A0ACB8D5X8_DERSI|nr:hypothetical protein HPB49_015056 [Dermacentor silvarum]